MYAKSIYINPPSQRFASLFRSMFRQLSPCLSRGPRPFFFRLGDFLPGIDGTLSVAPTTKTSVGF